MLAEIGNLLKKNYRIYSRDLLALLEAQGHTNLRASFLEILIFLLTNEGASIKMIGQACGLKKQTMTSHLNALEKRNYLIRQDNPRDKRQQCVNFTQEGEKLKFVLQSSIKELETKYSLKIGQLELGRIENILSNMHHKIKETEQSTLPF